MSTTYLPGFEPRYGTRTVDDAQHGARPDNNGFKLGANGRLCRCGKSHKAGSKAATDCRFNPANLTIDWDKQRRLDSNKGPANVQADSLADGRQVAGAGKGQKDKAK